MLEARTLFAQSLESVLQLGRHPMVMMMMMMVLVVVLVVCCWAKGGQGWFVEFEVLCIIGDDLAKAATEMGWPGRSGGGVLVGLWISVLGRLVVCLEMIKGESFAYRDKHVVKEERLHGEVVLVEISL